MADQYHIDSNIVTTSDSIEPVAGLVVNTTMTDSQSVISNVTTGGVGAKGDKGDKGDTGATGLKGDKGDTGLTGAAGTNGQGVPTGGTTGQQLAKINGTDYNTQWVNPVDISGKADTSALTAHTSNTSNPHSVTKAQVGLGSVPDTDFTSAIAAKQDTLVSGTNIKTINSTSILGSGDIVIGGAVDSVNTQTGVVVLDTDDIAEGTNKYVTSAEKTILSNTSGVNTGDQDISGIATNASNITGKVSKSGDTMTGNLAVNGSIYSSGNLGASNRMTLAIYNDTNYSDGLSIYKSGSAGVLGGAVKDGGEVGYHSFYAFDGTSDKRVAFVLVGADGDTTPTTGGGRYDIYVRNSAGTQVLPLSLTGANAEYQVNPIARTSLTYNLGSTARYWLNTYTQKLYLNSTAYLDGSVAGIVNISGGIKVTNSSTFSSPITVNSLSTGTAIDIRTPLNAFGESIYMTIQTRARIGYDGTGLVLDDNNTNKRVRISSNSRSWDFSTAGSFVAPGDMEITDTTKGVILKAPGGGRWRLTIDNSGNIVTTSI